MLDVDTGQHRTGVDPERAVAVGREIAALPGLRLAGALTHEGHLGAYLADRPGLESAGRGVGALLASVAAGLRGRPACRCEVVSVGSTPGIIVVPVCDGRHRGPAGHLRLLRRQPGAAGQCDVRPVRAHRPHSGGVPPARRPRDPRRRAQGDELGLDLGRGRRRRGACDLDATPLPDVTFPTANEEHGFLAGPGVNRLRVGDLVRVIPNHTCGTTNMWSRLHAVSPDGVEVWPIVARH